MIQITKTDLKEKVDAGWKKAALAAHYGLPVAQMTKVLQSAGLQIRKFHAPKFELLDDTFTVAQESLEATEAVLGMVEVDHVVTKEDIEVNPELTTLGVVEGDLITFTEEVTPLDEVDVALDSIFEAQEPVVLESTAPTATW